MAHIPESLRVSLEGSKAEYRQLGCSGLRVSLPILGAMSFGSTKWMPWLLEEDQVLPFPSNLPMSVAYHDQAMPILKGAFDRGLNTWDTANIYSNGESERIIGKAIKKYNMPRQKLIILSKCYGAVGEEPNVRSLGWEKEIFQSKDYVNLYGLSRTAIVSSVEASLERLQTSYLDLLQIHRFDPLVPIEETMSTLHDLVKAGKVRYLGASSMWTYQFAMMQSCAERNGWTKFISMQNHYNLLYREEEREMIRYCNETGVGLIPVSFQSPMAHQEQLLI